MSRCRCDEIQAIRNQIDVLNDASDRLEKCSSQAADLSRNMIKLSAYSMQAYCSNQMENICSAIKEPGTEMVAAVAKLHQKVRDKRTQLSFQLSETIQKDNEYHEEEGKKGNIGNSY